MPDYARIYARQEYMTPGAAETVAIIAETVRPDESTTLLDVASGKGEAASTLASQFGCRVVAVEPYDAFVHISAAKFWFFNLRDLVALLRADGKRLPLRDASVDAAYCIGAPSIVGLEPALAEMARVVRPGGHVIASDVVWRDKPGTLGADWRWLAAAPQLSVKDYALAIEVAGLRVDRTHVHNRAVWEDYFRPMLAVAQEAKTAQPADVFFADEVESGVELERRAVEAWLDYATFVATKPV
ncbi:MAG: methyltransferase domain-containing protein [Chloroflexota bacterium]|nr:methyltransferase domain-containing protein [Chloroflexota bacterium]